MSNGIVIAYSLFEAECLKNNRDWEADMSRNKPQVEDLDNHPEEYREDLNPDRMRGQNIGAVHPDALKTARTAYDLKPLHRSIDHILDDDLKQIPVLPEGERLMQGATYFDLKHPQRGEITATGDMSAGADNWYVAKTDVHYNLWNLLIGVDNPDRLGTGRE
jgi:hypothetical protein